MVGSSRPFFSSLQNHMAKFTDESKLTFGKFNGKMLKDVPASYLVWLYNQMVDDPRILLFNYLKENLAALEQEVGDEEEDE